MAKKKKKGSDSDDLGFGDLEDSFFATGEAGAWDDDEDEAAAGSAEDAAPDAAAEDAARVAAEKAAAEEAARVAAAEEAARAAAAEEAARVAAEQAAAEEAARAAAEQAAAAEQEAAAAAAEQEARFQAAEERQAQMARAEEQARLQGMGASPTIVADEDELADIDPNDLPETATLEDDQEGDEDEDEEYDGDEESDFEAEMATAESFVDAVDETMVLRRSPLDSDAIPASGFDTQERELARAEREALRAARDAEAADADADAADAPPPPQVPSPPPVAPPVADELDPAATLGRSVTTYTPDAADAARWQEAAAALEREARVETDPVQSAALYAEAGRIQFARLGNWEDADRLFSLATTGGVTNPDVLNAYADVVANRGDFEQLAELLERRADVSAGTAAAEALQDASLVARNSLRQEERAVALLERSLDLAPDDWFALGQLRQLHYRGERWAELATVLERMAALASGPRAARVYVELGRLREDRLEDVEGARQAYSAALDADAASAPAFLAQERVLRVLGDDTARSALYQREAGRLTGPDAAFWLAVAARVGAGADAGDDLVSGLYAQALELGGMPGLRREQQAFLEKSGRWDELAASLEQEVAQADDDVKAYALMRLAQVQERHLDKPDAAIENYTAATAADPSASPASEAVARLLAKTGRYQDLVKFYEKRVEKVDDPNRVVTIYYRMGEICEGPLEDQEAARTYFERILDTAPAYLPALEGLERVYTRLAAWDRLAAVYEQRAILAEEPAAIALQLHRAGSVCEIRLEDRDRAREFYRRALENLADFPPSVDAYLRILEHDGDWAGLARVLKNASEVTRDSNEMVSFTYRAARILADKVGDHEQAIACLQRCLELSPGFLPAIALYRELASTTSAWQTVYDLHRLEADAAEDLDSRHWRILAAAEASTRVEGMNPLDVAGEILAEDPQHSGALALLEEDALRSGDAGRALEIYHRMATQQTDETARSGFAVRVAELAREAGDSPTAMGAIAEVVGGTAEGRPLAALARVAESMNFWEEARRALATDSEGMNAELARLQETWGDEPAATAQAWTAVLAASPNDPEAAAGVERALTRLGQREGLAEAHAVLAEHVADTPIAAVHALLAGHLYEASGDAERARSFYLKAFEARPSRGKSFEALRRMGAQAEDADALIELFGKLPNPVPLELAGALEEAGATDRAIDIYQQELEGKDDDRATLPVLVRLEHALYSQERWSELYQVLTRRRALLMSDDEKSAVEGKQRWVLAEHLAETDEAWEIYRQLHEQHPDDAEVLEALARIAGARGETDLAIQYLTGLAGVADSTVEAARYHRRIAEAQRAAGNDTAAQEAYLEALDLNPEDLDALAGLKDLAQASENWPSLVGVLAREATVTEGEEQLSRYREIARIWEDHIGDEAVAGDSWRKVLELDADDAEALTRLVDLSRKSKDWGSFVDHAERLAGQHEGAERSQLQAEIGRVHLRELRRQSEALRFLDAASSGEHPNAEAAELLEQLHASQGAWDRVVDALLRRARATQGEDAVGHLVKAAETARDTLHNRDQAADIYALVLEQQPDHGDAQRFRGEYLFERGDFSGAVEIFEAMKDAEVQRDTDDFDVRIEVSLYFFRYAEALRQVGRRADAVEQYEAALELNPSHLPTLEAVGPTYMEESEWEKAGQVYRRMLQLTGGQGDPEKIARTYVNLGIVERHLGHLDKARKRFTKALDIRPNDVRALQGIAGVLFDKGDWNNLLNVYNNIIYHAQEPAEVVDAYLTKGFVLDAKMSMPDKAAQHYEKSLAFDPAQPAVLLRLAELALRRQDWPEAASLADRGLAVDEREAKVSGGLHLVKAIAHGACGDDAAATEGVDAAVQADDALKDALAPAGSPEGRHEVLRERLWAGL